MLGYSLQRLSMYIDSVRRQPSQEKGGCQRPGRPDDAEPGHHTASRPNTPLPRRPDPGELGQRAA